MGKTLYIINPAGHGGAGIKAWGKFKSNYPDRIPQEDVIITERPGLAREIATLSDGYEILAAAGGDGTVGEVMTAILSRNACDATLAIIPAGTGNDIARNAGIRFIGEAVSALQNGTPKAFDIMRVESQLGGRRAVHYPFPAGPVWNCRGRQNRRLAPGRKQSA